MSELNPVWRTKESGSGKTMSRLSISLWIVAGVLALAACAYGVFLIGGFRSYRVASSSMADTIYEGDTILCNLNAYRSERPKRGDVVVFRHKEYILIKRLIAMEGDRVEGRDGIVSVNGEVLKEPYAERIGESMNTLDNFGPAVVAPGTVFVLGDNRNHSLDSRLHEFGKVRLSDITGRAVSILRSDHGRARQAVH